MIRVQFKKFSRVDEIPTWLDPSVRAVPAESFEEVDEGQGGITTRDIIDTGMVAPVGSFPAGSEVYIESEDVTDCLDDETVEAEGASHIWWLARIMMEGESVPEGEPTAPFTGSA